MTRDSQIHLPRYWANVTVGDYLPHQPKTQARTDGHNLWQPAQRRDTMRNKIRQCAFAVLSIHPISSGLAIFIHESA